MNYHPTFFGGIIYDSSNFSYIGCEELQKNSDYKPSECQMMSLNIINKCDFLKELNYDFNYFKKYLINHFEGNNEILKNAFNHMAVKDVDTLFHGLWQDFLFDGEFYLFDILKSNITFFLKKKEYSKLCNQLLSFWLAEQFMYSCIGEIIGQYLSSKNFLFLDCKLNESDKYLKNLFFKLEKNRPLLRMGVIDNKTLNRFLEKDVFKLQKGFIGGLIEYVERDSCIKK
jgi:hypothetical protein